MKPKSTFRSFLAIASSSLLAISYTHAAVYYWDTNSTTSGLGDTAGTWGTSAFRATYPIDGTSAVLDGTATTVSTATGTGDQIYFGTNNLSLGSLASTIGIAGGGVSINSIVFGTGQASQGVTLSGGGGTITLAGTTPTITSNNTGTNIIGAVLVGTVGMTTAGSGTLTLTNASNTLSGGVTVTGGGRLNLGNGTTGGFSATTNALTFNAGGGTFNLAKADTGSQTMGALSFSAGDGAVISTAATGSATQTLTFGSFTARTTGATGNFSLATNATASQNKIVLTSSTNAPLNGSGSNDRGLFFGGTEYARYDTTAGYFRAVNYGTDFNASAIVGTGLTLGINDATKDVKISGDITAQTTASVSTLNLAASNLTLSDTSQVISVNGILSAGAASASIATAGKIQATSNGGEIVIRVNGASDGLSIAPIIQNAGGSASALTKSGAGTLTLSGTNTYTGTTFINGGTLALSNGAAIVDTGAVSLANAAGTTLLLNNSETVGQLSGGGFSGGNVNVGANTLTIANANNQTFGGQFTGTSGGGVTISSGTLTLSNKNSFAGTIALNGGTLALAYGYDGTANPAPLSSGGAISMANGTFLNLVPAASVNNGVGAPALLNRTGGFGISNAINITSGTATIQTTSASGANDWKWIFSGNVTGGTSGAQTLAIAPGGATAVNGGDRANMLFSGIIQNGSGGSTLGVSVDFKAGTGTGQEVNVNLSGQNTFTGPIVVNNTRGLEFLYGGPTGNNRGGYLAIGGETNRSFYAGRSVTVGSGYLAGGDYTNTISLATGTALNYISSANQTLGGVISGGGNLVMDRTAGAANVGTLTLTQANTFSGVSIVNNGILRLTNALALQNSAYDTTNSTTGTSLIGLRIGTTTLTLGGLIGNKNFISLFETNADGGPGGTTGRGGYDGLAALTLNPNSGSVTYTANIADATTGMTLAKTGAGTQILSGTNSYTGGTTISNGILQFGKLVSQPASGAVAVSTGGTLGVNVGGTGEWTTATSGIGTIGGLLGGLGGQSGGTVTYSGNVALGFDTTNGFANPNGIATQTYSGAIANVGTTLGITKLGTNILFLAGNNTYGGATTVNAGRLVLNGTNSYTGGSFINGGMLQFGKLTAQPASGAVAVGTGATLAVNLGGTGEWTTGTSGNGTIGGLLAGLGGQSGGTVTYSGNVALGFDTSNATSTQTYSNAIANVGGTLGITKLGTGTLTLTGVNTYTGATTVNGGTLLLDKTGTGGTAALATSSALVLGGGNFQMKGKNSLTTTQTLGALTLTANTNNTITLDSNGGTGTTLTLANSGPTRGVGSSLLIDRTIANTTLTTTFGLTAAAQTTIQGILGYALVKDATGTGFATNVGGSIVRYTGADTSFSAASNSSTTNFKTTPTGTSTTGSPYISVTTAASAYNSLHIDTASATGANFLTLNGTQPLTSGGLLMTGNNAFTIQGGTQLGANNSELIVHQTGTGTLTISSKISSGSGSLTKDGTGTLIVTNSTNAYTGSTTLNAGTLQYASKTAFGTSTLYLAGGTKLQKVTEEANVVGNAMANNIILTGGQVEMNVDFSNAKDQWFTGIVSGLGSLRITGSGTGRQVAFSGNNTFTGGVTLDTANAAWIRLANANGLGAGTLTINQTGGNQTSGLGADGNLTSGIGVANNIVINPGATFNLGGGTVVSGNMLLSGVISGAGNLNKSDNAATTYILSGSNTFTGSTRVTLGTLQLGNGGTTGSLTGTSGITNNANLTINRSNAFTQATDLNNKAITGTGSFTQAGGGTTTLSLTNTYSGATTVTGGKLIIDGSTAAGSAVSVGASGTLGGTGTINGTLTLTGILAPGTANGNIETLDAGATTWNGGSIWNFDLSSVDTTSDQLAITGAFTKGTGSGFQFNFMGSQPVWNTTYTLATFGSLAGGFTAGDVTPFSYTNLGSGSYSTSYFTLNGTSLQFTAIPEPTTALAGLLLTAGLLRRRRGRNVEF